MPEEYKANSTVRLPDPPTAAEIKRVIEAYCTAAELSKFTAGVGATMLAGIEIGLSLARDYPEAVTPVLTAIDNESEKSWDGPESYDENIAVRAESVRLLGDAALGVNVAPPQAPGAEFRWN